MKKLFFLSYLLLAFANGYSQAKDTLIDDKVFSRVEVEAEFPGGVRAWVDHLRKNLNANTPVNNGAPMGKYLVIIRFIVSREGKISEVFAETKHGYGMEAEAIRAIKAGPNWIPAQQNGRKVNAYRRQPIAFHVAEEDLDIVTPKIIEAGKDNIINVEIKKVKNEDIDLEVDNGTVVKRGDGRFSLTPATAGKAIISIFVTRKGKRTKYSSAYLRIQ